MHADVFTGAGFADTFAGFAGNDTFIGGVASTPCLTHSMLPMPLLSVLTCVC